MMSELDDLEQSRWRTWDPTHLLSAFDDALVLL